MPIIRLNDDSHLRSVTKLRSVAYLLSQAELELEMPSEVLHGLAWTVDECVGELAPVAEGGAK